MLDFLIKITPLISPIVVVVSVAIAYGALRRTTRNNLDERITSINENFVTFEVVGPIVSAVFPDRSIEAKLEVQKKIVMMLLMVNLIRGYWSSYNKRILGLLPGIPKADWDRNRAWFESTVWPWIEADEDLLLVAKHLLKQGDLQEDGFAGYVTAFMRKNGERQYLNA